VRAPVGSTQGIGTALVVLCWLSASSSLAADAPAGDLGPVRQRVAHSDGLLGSAEVPIGPVTPLRTPVLGRSHAREGAIVGAVVLGVLGGWYLGVMGGWGCEAHPYERCDEALQSAAAGAAGGALVGGAVGGLVGSWLQTTPSALAQPSRARTRVRLLPRRGGMGIALSHSF